MAKKGFKNKKAAPFKKGGKGRKKNYPRDHKGRKRSAR